jgi:hypothetical protein
MTHSLSRPWQAVWLAAVLHAAGCQISLSGVPISEDDAEELHDDDPGDGPPPSDDAADSDNETDDGQDGPDADDVPDPQDDEDPAPVDDGGPRMDAGFETDGGLPDAGPGPDASPAADGGDDTDGGNENRPAPGTCAADEAFAPARCAQVDSSPYQEPYCACVSPDQCAAHHPLAACIRDDEGARELELQLGGGDSDLLEGDLTVHFRTAYDSVLTRAARFAIRGDDFSVRVEHEGWSFFASDVARSFPEGCEEEAEGEGQCTESTTVASWTHCYQHCAGLPTMQVWSYQQLDASNTQGSCQCGELAGEAVPSLRARSGRLRDGPAATPVLAAPAQGNTRTTLPDDKLPDPTDLETCKNTCLAAAGGGLTAKCLSWVYTPGDFPDNGNCYLQNDTKALALRYPFSNFITGLSPAGTLVEQALARSLLDNSDRPYADVGWFDAGSWDACADRCTRQSNCRTFAFSKDGKRCYMKEGATPIVVNPKSTSAIRPTLVVRVRHTTARGATEVKLRAHRQAYFDGTLSVVRDAALRKYTLYVNGAWASDAYYRDDPVVGRSTVHIAGAAVAPRDALPVSELAVFDQRLDRAALAALRAIQSATTAPDPDLPESDEPDAGDQDDGELDAGIPRCDGPDCSVVLDSLKVNRGALSPAFHPLIGAYTLRLKPWEDSVDVTATASDGLTLALDDEALASGEPSRVSVMPGSTALTLTASRGDATRTYTIQLERSMRAARTIKASNGQAGDKLSLNHALAISADGNTMVVGALDEDSSGAGVDPLPDEEVPGSGAVYVLTRNARGGFTERAFIKAFNPGVADHFGDRGIALSGDGNTLAVAAPGEDSLSAGVDSVPNDDGTDAGAVYLYSRVPGGGWLPEAYLKAHNPGPSDWFGMSVALSYDGSTLAVGAHCEDSSTQGVNPPVNDATSNSGATYVFTRSAGAWRQQAFLKGHNTEFDDRFGSAVALDGSGDLLVVGAHGEDSSGSGVNGVSNNNALKNAGAAYVFRRSFGTWAEEAYLKADYPSEGDFFAERVALSIDGTTLAVGSPREDSSRLGPGLPDETAADAGAAYVFVYERGGWTQQAYVKATNISPGDAFGQSVSLNGDGSVLAVGAGSEGSISGDPGDNAAANVGAAYVYTREAQRWTDKAYLKAPQLSPGDRFGSTLVVDGDGRLLVVGAPYEDSSGSGQTPNEDAMDSGAVHVF